MQTKKTSLILMGILFIFSTFRFVALSSASTVNPGDSIQAAINDAQPGDTILIKNGSYLQYRIIVNKTLTILGEHAEGTVVDGGGAGDASVIFHVIANNVKISNLTVKNAASGFGPAGIIIANASMAEVSECIIRNSSTGLLLLNSNSCKIERNKILQNTVKGIDLQPNSTNNRIVNNLIFNNSVGIQVELYVTLNKIYHNNIIDNSEQIDGFGLSMNTWDNGYPSGGNYWSDYIGVDLLSGPGQNLSGSDGIGDDPAHIYDNYPFMGQLFMFLAIEWDQIDYYVMIASNSTEVSNFCFIIDTTSPYLKFDVEGLEFLWGFCRVSISKQLLGVEEGESWQVLINETSVEPSITEDSEYTYMYLNYTHSTLSIQIIGTYAIPEITVPMLIILMVMFGVQVLLIKKLKVRKL